MTRGPTPGWERLGAFGLLIAATASASLGHAAEDVDGAADPAGFERFPGSWIVAYTPAIDLRSYEFVTGRVDRSGRTVRVDESTRLAAELVRVTYRAMDQTRFDEVVDYYRGLVVGQGGDVVFTCEARACGRSTSWANSVFGIKELVAPDSSQFYLAAARGRTLVAVYVVQRGNRRVYAHIDVAEAETAFGTGPEGGLVHELQQRGFVVLTGVVPDPDGKLDVADLQAVDAVAAEIESLAERTLYVVCHLSRVDGTEAAMARSATCAEAIVERLRTNGISSYGFGGGPLLPRIDAPPERVELVLLHPGF